MKTYINFALAILLLLLMAEAVSANSGRILVSDMQLDGQITSNSNNWTGKAFSVGDTAGNDFMKGALRFNLTNESSNISSKRNNITVVTLYVFLSGKAGTPTTDLLLNYTQNDSWTSSLKNYIVGSNNITDYNSGSTLFTGTWIGFDITSDFINETNNYTSVVIEPVELSLDNGLDAYLINSSEAGVNIPVIEIKWDDNQVNASSRRYNLSNISKPILYERLRDNRPNRSLQQHTDIINETQTDFIFRSNWRVNPMIVSCNNYTGATKTACESSGYSRELQNETIDRIRDVNPNITIIGALMAQRMNRTETDEYTNITYNENQTYAMSLNLSKWNITVFNQSELQDMLTGGIGGLGNSTWYPDITNDTVRLIFLDQAKQQIDSGVDGIWIDFLFFQVAFFDTLKNSHNVSYEQALLGSNDSYWASIDLINDIKDYGNLTGKTIYVGTWRKNAVRFTRFFSNQSAPNIDFLTESPSRSEVSSGTISSNQWQTAMNSTKDVFGNDIPVISFIDWSGTSESQMSYFSQNMTVSQQSNFLIKWKEFYDDIGIKFVQPMHGGSFYDGATVLANGVTGWYDSKAPEFHTYPTILALSRNNFSVTPDVGTIANGDLNISISVWNVTGDYYKKWNESMDVSSNTVHIIGDFPANISIEIKRNGIKWGAFMSNQTGYINYTYDGGYSEHQFESQIATIPPTPTTLANTTGNFWVNHTWSQGSGNVTNSYNVSVNGTWTNGSANTFKNESVGAHGWSNITILSYNSTALGSLNTTAISQNTIIPNNVPVQSVIGSKTAYEGNWINFSINSTDTDSDSLTYQTNATVGTLSENNFNWSTNYVSSGVYFFTFNTSDNYGGVDSETVEITILNSPISSSSSGGGGGSSLDTIEVPPKTNSTNLTNSTFSLPLLENITLPPKLKKLSEFNWNFDINIDKRLLIGISFIILLTSLFLYSNLSNKKLNKHKRKYT